MFLAAIVAAYAVLAVTGQSFVIYKTLVIPAFITYALFVARPRVFLRDWLPLLAAVVLFDVCRGAIYSFVVATGRPILEHYVIALERALVGTGALASTWQRHEGYRIGDALAATLHASHFVFFLVFGVAIWNRNPRAFRTWRAALVLVMAGGLLGYLLWPTVPPWLASTHGLLPPMARVIEQTYLAHVPAIAKAFDTNPVAAMPSLHAAFPSLAAIVGWRFFGLRAGIALAMYAVAVCAAVVYLGEHYVVDLVAGAALAGAAAGVVAAWDARRGA